MLTLKELTDRSFALGYQAAERNESRAPAMNSEFMEMMKASKGADWIQPLQAFAHGYQAKCDEDADAVSRGVDG